MNNTKAFYILTIFCKFNIIIENIHKIYINIK